MIVVARSTDDRHIVQLDYSGDGQKWKRYDRGMCRATTTTSPESL